MFGKLDKDVIIVPRWCLRVKSDREQQKSVSSYSGLGKDLHDRTLLGKKKFFL